MPATAIIAASGQGRRMASPVKKQYLVLDGIPVLARTIKIFLDHGGFTRIIVVIPPGEAVQTSRILKPHIPLDNLILVEGGRRRQDSVFNGLRAAEPGAGLICIHDGARPLLSIALLKKVLKAAARWGAAVPVIPVTDTLKEVTPEGVIKQTVRREFMRRVQTPQVFREELIREAYAKAASLGVEATDDAYLLELLGYDVMTVPGENGNIKITSPEDLLIAAALLRGEE